MNISRERKSFKSLLHNFPEGLVAHPMYKGPLFRDYLNREKETKKEIEFSEKEKRILLITPPEKSPTTVFTTDPKKLKQTYEMGKLAAKKIINFARNSKTT